MYILNIGSGFMGFPGSSAGKESTCNAGDSSAIPELGRSPGEGTSYPLQYSGLETSMDCIGYLHQYSWASLVAQLVKNPPAVCEAWVLSVGGEELLEKGPSTHSSILAWREFHGLYSPWGSKESDITE